VRFRRLKFGSKCVFGLADIVVVIVMGFKFCLDTMCGPVLGPVLGPGPFLGCMQGGFGFGSVLVWFGLVWSGALPLCKSIEARFQDAVFRVDQVVAETVSGTRYL
jgi:hypothetical protein